MAALVRKTKRRIEIFDPIETFYRMVSKSEKMLLFGIPILLGVLGWICSNVMSIKYNITSQEIADNLLGDFITTMALFVSFTVGYLSMIISSGSKNVESIRNKPSEKYFGKDNEPYTLYQILTTQITYNVIIEIIFLLMCMVERVLLNCVLISIAKIFCAIDIAIFSHILMILIIIVQNIYFAFWKSE